MATSLDVNSMRKELQAANVALWDLAGMDIEEEYNYIIHLYDVFFLKDYTFAVETAQIMCTNKINRQPWQRAYGS